MLLSSIKFKGHRCFKATWSGFDGHKPLTAVIGRNNTGKSYLLDLVGSLCNKQAAATLNIRATAVLDEPFLREVFLPNHSGGRLIGNHWTEHGAKLVGQAVEWEGGPAVPFKLYPLPDPIGVHPTHLRAVAEERTKLIDTHLRKVRHHFEGKIFRRLLADRDIRPEPASLGLELDATGRGATNIVRRHLLTADASFPRELIQDTLLDALNLIFAADAHFTELYVKVHDEASSTASDHNWEVYLGEEHKGLIALSASGSGLKTVLLVLLNLLVVPQVKKRKPADFVFAFEELENNLHPALLRRLLQYLEDFAVREQTSVFLTTHSSTAVDMFGVSDHAQLVHVTHDGAEARAATVSAHFDHLGVISELGARPSDLLQANGIVWVEGPSDYIYLNRWIDLFSNRTLREGRDYQCAFYGGSLLARTQFTSPEAAEVELVNLFRINPNIVVVCDSDKTAASGEGSRIKERVRRINSEIGRIPGAHAWITGAREIENYIPGSVLDAVYKGSGTRAPEQFERFFPSDSSTKKGQSFVESVLRKSAIDKMDLAIQSVPHMTHELLKDRFDLAASIQKVIERIRAWNH